ncbi:MAG: hypothetical protein BRD37_01585 [Bacteroidetes bacterium QH_8_67_23]|nr:MAG: hypothetical protein BRD37_01585 [Bacteroidetes bacterium QH_8_67_23]
MVPHELRRLLEGDVFTTQFMGWDQLQNGQLLEACDERGFDVLLTHDKNMRHQQELTQYQTAVLQLDAPSNDPEDVRLLVPQINEALRDLTPGEFVVVG